MSNALNAAALVALVLVEAVRIDGAEYAPGSTKEFAPADAERLVRLGAAVPTDDPRAQAIAAGAVVTKEIVVEKEVLVEKVVEVRALSKEGGKFLQFKKDESLTDYISGFTDAATLAEFQALEYRREGGPRPAVIAALNVQFDKAFDAAASAS